MNNYGSCPRNYIDFTFNQGAVYNIPGPFNPEISKISGIVNNTVGFSLEDITISNFENYPDWLFEQNLRNLGERLAMKQLHKSQEKGDKCKK